MISPQKQIVVQDVLRELVSKLPEFNVGGENPKAAFFDYGNEIEINRRIKANSGDIYPLIWLLPSKNSSNVKSNISTRNLVIIVATIENRLDILNDQRMEDALKKTLFPIRDHLVHVLNNSSATKLRDSDVVTYEFPKYIDKEKSVVVDNWDAIRIECEVDFLPNKCIKNFRWTI